MTAYERPTRPSRWLWGFLCIFPLLELLATPALTQESIGDYGYMGDVDTGVLTDFLWRQQEAAQARPGGAVVDVLVVNSLQRAAAHSPSYLEDTDRQLVEDVTAMLLARSGVPHRFRLVGSEPVGFDETLDEDDALHDELDWLRLSPAVHNLRKAYRADVVLLSLEFSEAGASGRAFISADSSHAFGVFDAPEYSGNLVVAHELGHIMGATHDQYDPEFGGGELPNHGHLFRAAEGGWNRTIMAITCNATFTPCHRYLGYSNPDVEVDGVPTGTRDLANVAAVLRDTMPQVAQFSEGRRKRVCSNLTQALTACLQGGRFSLSVGWYDGTRHGVAALTPAWSSDSAVFSFFAPDNWELLVKALDGCAVNSHFWIFYAATTNVEFEIQIEDLVAGKSAVYQNTLGHLANTIADTRAFSTCP